MTTRKFRRNSSENIAAQKEKLNVAAPKTSQVTASVTKADPSPAANDVQAVALQSPPLAKAPALPPPGPSVEARRVQLQVDNVSDNSEKSSGEEDVSVKAPPPSPATTDSSNHESTERKMKAPPDSPELLPRRAKANSLPSALPSAGEMQNSSAAKQKTPPPPPALPASWENVRIEDARTILGRTTVSPAVTQLRTSEQAMFQSAYTRLTKMLAYCVLLAEQTEVLVSGAEGLRDNLTTLHGKIGTDLTTVSSSSYRVSTKETQRFEAFKESLTKYSTEFGVLSKALTGMSTQFGQLMRSTDVPAASEARVAELALKAKIDPVEYRNQEKLWKQLVADWTQMKGRIDGIHATLQSIHQTTEQSLASLKAIVRPDPGYYQQLTTGISSIASYFVPPPTTTTTTSTSENKTR